MDHIDHGSSATLERLSDTIDLCHRAITAGVKVAQAVHAQQRWDPRADAHLLPHLVRREALEIIKEQQPETAPEDDLGAPMSALRLQVGTLDSLRIWHGRDGVVSIPSSTVGRQFLVQRSIYDRMFPPFDEPARPLVCRTVLIWDSVDGELSHFRLVRPVDFTSGRVVTDWSVSLLDRFQHRVADVQYRRRDVRGEDSESA